VGHAHTTCIHTGAVGDGAGADGVWTTPALLAFTTETVGGSQLAGWEV